MSRPRRRRACHSPEHAVQTPLVVEQGRTPRSRRTRPPARPASQVKRSVRSRYSPETVTGVLGEYAADLLDRRIAPCARRCRQRSGKSAAWLRRCEKRRGRPRGSRSPSVVRRSHAPSRLTSAESAEACGKEAGAPTSTQLRNVAGFTPNSSPTWRRAASFEHCASVVPSR